MMTFMNLFNRLMRSYLFNNHGLGCNLPKTCGSRSTKGGMTLYRIGYVEIGSILVLPGTISATGCD
jgi:hypothetical protein